MLKKATTVKKAKTSLNRRERRAIQDALDDIRDAQDDIRDAQENLRDARRTLRRLLRND